MTTVWEFYPQQPTDPIHNPISGEFFSTEAVGNVADALVRESLQNTLDARKRLGNGSRHPARVRIFLSEASGALSAAHSRRWFWLLWPHVMARSNGLRDQPTPTDPCPYLVLEDFGTTGLTGDPEEYRVIDGKTNHFLNFFRAEGHSDKGERDRGSWGVGKTVFPRASRISSFFGLTVRSDDHKQLLFGRSILKYHRVNEQPYKSDGYFGHRRDDGFLLPTDDPPTLAEFRQQFSITRTAEDGLSIVVPWCETTGDNGLTRERVVAAVLKGFFYPILMGHLSVTIQTAVGATVALDAGSLASTVEAIGGSLALELLPMIRLAAWAQSNPPVESRSLTAPPAERAQNWTTDLVPADVLKHIRESFADGRRVALRVPMAVQSRAVGLQHTFFRIFLEHCEEDRERPVFIRDELIISDVKSPRIPHVRSLVVVEDGPLATLLRDAETPAHTQWNQGTSNFKNKYKFGPGAINFVRLSVSELMRIISQTEHQPDPSLTVEFFSVQATPDDEEAIQSRQRRPRRPEGPHPPAPPPPPPPARLRRFRIAKLRGGFAIRAGDPAASLPSLIEVRVAYDVRRGNPLKKYHPDDFDLANPPIHWNANTSGAKIKSASANRLLASITSPGFNLEVTGFDPERDLYVKAEVKETPDGD